MSGERGIYSITEIKWRVCQISVKIYTILQNLKHPMWVIATYSPVIESNFYTLVFEDFKYAHRLFKAKWY